MNNLAIVPCINTPEDLLLASYEKKMKRIHTLIHGMMAGTINGVVIAGAPGIGKSHNVEEALAQYGDAIEPVWVKGHITPFSTFTTLQQNNSKNSLVIFDDADSAFQDVGALNLLKAATDTKAVRVVTWLSSANKGEQSFIFEGKVIILTNVSLKKSPHFKAMLDRFICYDPDVSVQEKLHKIRDLASKETEISSEVGSAVIDFLFNNQHRLEDISIRTFVKASQLAASLGDAWIDLAECTMLLPEAQVPA